MDYDFLKFRNNWFEMYRMNLGERYHTFKAALNLLYQRETHNIIETGCLREIGDWGGGQSTFIFGQFISRHGGHLTTIDISERNMNIAKEVTAPYAEQITYIIGNSLTALETLTEPIDLLYLDSMDCPVEGDAAQPQQHNLNEFLTIEKLLRPGSVILLDDADFSNGGKVRLTCQYLWQSGKYECVMNYQQSLWRVR